MEYNPNDFSQAAINSGQRKINYALTVVDEKLAKALQALCDALAEVVGLTSDAAKARAGGLKAIRIKTEDARKVFIERSVPSYQAQTEQAFPGVNNLPADAQGALVSLVYNRGTSMSGDRRREMRAIRDAVPKGDLREIANQLRSMKRLWQGTDVSGLVARREAEAQLVESCIT